jgi:hypothetical protein
MDFYFLEKKTNKQRENPKSGFSSSAMRGLLVLSFILIAFRPLLENRVTRREKQIDPNQLIPSGSGNIFLRKKKSFRPTVSSWMSAPLALLRPPHFFLFHYLFIDLFESFFVCVCIPY